MFRLPRFKRARRFHVSPMGTMTVTHRGPEEGHAVHVTLQERDTRKSLTIVMPRHLVWQPLGENLFRYAQRIDLQRRRLAEREEDATARMEASIERHNKKIAFRVMLKVTCANAHKSDYQLMRARTKPSKAPDTLELMALNLMGGMPT